MWFGVVCWCGWDGADGVVNRFWLPNLQNKTFRSEALDKDVEVKVSTKALKTIRKVCSSFLFLLLSSCSSPSSSSSSSSSPSSPTHPSPSLFTLRACSSPLLHTPVLTSCAKRFQYGGIDPYLLQTPSSLLGYEGIRLRILVHTATQTNNAIASRIAKLGTDDPKTLLADLQKDVKRNWKDWDWNSRVGKSDVEGEGEGEGERQEREERRDRVIWEGNRLGREERALERRAGIDPEAWIREEEKKEGVTFLSC